MFPIHHAARSYGYMVFLNDNMPVDQYIYRIFQESLGDSINNLHQKMEVTGERDLVIRYGGDEFLILSENTDPQAWERIREKLNSLLRSSVEKQRLLYPVGVSMGYAVTDGTEPAGLDRQIELADGQMYEDKKKRRMKRETPAISAAAHPHETDGKS